MPPNNFANIIQAAKHGCNDAIRILVEHYQFVVEVECRRLEGSLGAEMSGADLNQEVWIRVWSRIGHFKGATDPSGTERMFIAWLKKTARTVSINQIAKRRAQKRLPRQDLLAGDAALAAVADDNSTASRVIEQNEELQRLKRAVETLTDPVDIRIIQGRFDKGMSTREIAKELGLTYEQVRYRFNQLLNQLRDQL